jgi:poly-gamma-glutamate capsule biosynthesis protein CapA/YwtB (metallophosphatase superfamily)
MHIGQIHLVSDLTDGQRVYPDPDHSYQIQSEDDPSLDTTVQYVERRGDRLIARGHNGQDYGQVRTEDHSELAQALARFDLATTPHSFEVWAFSRWLA